MVTDNQKQMLLKLETSKNHVFKEIDKINNPFLLEAIITQSVERLESLKKKLRLNYKSYSSKLIDKIRG